MPRSESQKQLDELAKQQEQDRKYSGPAVAQYGYESGGDIGVKQSEIDAKKAEIDRTIRQKTTPAEYSDYIKRRYGK